MIHHPGDLHQIGWMQDHVHFLCVARHLTRYLRFHLIPTVRMLSELMYTWPLVSSIYSYFFLFFHPQDMEQLNVFSYPTFITTVATFTYQIISLIPFQIAYELSQVL